MNVFVYVCVCIRIIEASELSVEDRMARSISHSIERVGDVRYSFWSKSNWWDRANITDSNIINSRRIRISLGKTFSSN